MIIERKKYLDKLIARIDNKMIKVITGVRRSGKSVLLFDLFYHYLVENGVPEDHIIMLSLDDIANSEYRDPEKLYAFLKEKILNSSDHYFIFLDEIQLAISKAELKQKDTNVRLYGVLNGLLRKGNADVYVTGSNSKLLATDVLTEFRGRGDEVHVLPLSFSEYFPAVHQSKEEAWQDYLLYGGMPQLLSLRNDEQKAQYLTSLNKEIYLRDIQERYEVANLAGMEELMKVIASSVGSLTNPQRISDTFKSSGIKGISSPTIKGYLTYLQDAGLISKAERYDVKGRKYISTPAKYYYADTGLRNALLGFRQFEETHLMENIIFNELKSRGYGVDVGIVETRPVDASGKRQRVTLEIDFIAHEGSRKYYIQSAFALPDEDKKAQEERPLLAVDDSFKKIIIVAQPIKVRRDERGIMTMGIYDFLLQQDSLEQ